MLLENMSMAVHAIKANKMRSFLTMLGIIIGIGSVIAIVSVGDTMRSMIAGLYDDIGLTRAIVYIWSRDGESRDSDYFNLEQIEHIKEVFDDIEYIDTSAYCKADAVFGKNKIKFEFQGIDYNYIDVQNVDMIYGRFFNEGDIKARKNNVILEAQGAIDLFGTDNAIGKSFRTEMYGITGEYNVIGVYKKKDSPLAAMMGGSQDAVGFLPYTILSWPNDSIFQLNLFAKEGTDMVHFSSRLTSYLARTKQRNPEDVVFYSAIDELSANDSMMSGLSAAVGGIAAISLLVGGIGIMNIMLVSVTERTREIGIRKALGARTKDVLVQFLTESAILSAIGGVLGVIIGAGLIYIGGALMGVAVVVKPVVIIIAVGFSALVGVGFGLYPASKAAKSDPIESLRYE